jgi:protein arginine kinase activator
MKCERCGEREASLEYVDIVEGTKTSVWLCPACARAEGVSADLEEAGEDEETDLIGFVGAFMAKQSADASEPPVEPAVCPECGYTSQQLEEKNLVGCPACYKAFRASVLPLLERYHRGVAHVGKAPRADGPRAALRRELADLRAALERAVAAEGYEEAARLRDRIRARESELERLAGRDAASPARSGDEDSERG